MKRPFAVRVECYSGYKADERPLRFFLAEQCYEVAEVLDQWYSPGCVCFRLRADDGNVYILRHTSRGQEDYWNIEAFRRR